MPTVVPNTVGVGKTYSTWQLWYDAASNLVSNDQIWQGLGTGEFLVTGTSTIVASGKTTSATQYFHMVPDTNQAFSDPPNNANNPGKYDASKGTGIRWTAGYNHLFNFGSEDFVIERLQLQHLGGNGIYGISTQSAAKQKFLNCIIEFDSFIYNVNNPPKFHQCIIWGRGTRASITAIAAQAEVRNCTILRPTDLTTILSGVKNYYANYPSVKNTAVMGAFTAPMFQGTLGSYAACNNNASSDATGSMPGTANVGSLTPSGQFQNVLDGTRDARPKAGSGLINAGVRDAAGTNDQDILGKPRSLTTPTIGAMEYVAPASILSGGFTLDDIVASGTLASIASSLSGGIALDDIVASGTLGAAPGVLTVPALKNWTGLLLAAQLVEKIVVIRIADLATLATFTDRTSDGSGDLALTSAAFVPGTACMVVGFNVDGSARFARAVTVV